MANPQLTRNIPSRLSSWTNRYCLALRCKRSIAVVLAVIMINVAAPPATASSLALQAVSRAHDTASQTWRDIKSWFNRRQDSNPRRGIKPREPESKAEREARVASLQVNPGRSVTLESREPINFTAVPLDAEDMPVNGLRAEWESSDKQIIFVKKTGQAVAGKPGHAVVRAKAGNVAETINVEVIASTGKGGKKKHDSTPAGTIPSSQVETKPTNCEFNISVLTGAHQKAGDNLVIMIARLGTGETLRNLNKRRLHNARTFLTEFGQRAPQTIVTAEGDGVDGYGRVEVYVEGKLFHVLMIRKNDDLAVGACSFEGNDPCTFEREKKLYPCLDRNPRRR